MKAGVSKWNANNYHWEEKNLMPWVEQYLNEIYNFFYLKIKF